MKYCYEYCLINTIKNLFYHYFLFSFATTFLFSFVVFIFDLFYVLPNYFLFYTKVFNERFNQFKGELFMLNVGRVNTKSDLYLIESTKLDISTSQCMILKTKQKFNFFPNKFETFLTSSSYIKCTPALHG